MRLHEIIVEYANNRIPNWDNLDPQQLIRAIVDSARDGRHLNAWIAAVNNVWRGRDNNYTQNFLTAYNTLKNSIDPSERAEYAGVLKYAHANRVNSDTLRQFKPSLFKVPSTRRNSQPTASAIPTDDENSSELVRNLNRRQRMLQALNGDDGSDEEIEPQQRSAADRILKWLPSTVYATVLAIMADPERAKGYLKMPWDDISARAYRGDPYAAALLVANRVRVGNVSVDRDADIPGGAKKRSMDTVSEDESQLNPQRKSLYISPTTGAGRGLSRPMRRQLANLANSMMKYWRERQPQLAINLWTNFSWGAEDNNAEKVFVWSLIRDPYIAINKQGEEVRKDRYSDLRTAIKKYDSDRRSFDMADYE